MNIFNAKHPGSPVGPSRGPQGHLTVPITFYDNQCMKRLRPSYARIVYMLHNDKEIGEGLYIDHLDGDPSNNNPANLRAIPPHMNVRNAVYKPGRSGVVGVQLSGDRYTASIGVGEYGEGGKQFHLGTYDTIEEAMAARGGAGKILGYTSRHLKGRESPRNSVPEAN